MAVRPFTQVSIGGVKFIVESINTSYQNLPFDRVEFDHQRLTTARLTNGVSAIVIQLVGNIPSEVTYKCAVGNDYTPRPLTPNAFPADWQNVKQKLQIVRFSISCGQTPETANPGGLVDTLFNTAQAHFNLNTQFQTRLAIFGADIDYVTLLNSQSDNIITNYFTTGLTLITPDTTVSNVLITEFTETTEFAIPNANGSYEVLKGFNAVFEARSTDTAV